jgi:dienelactone hydrolase
MENIVKNPAPLAACMAGLLLLASATARSEEPLAPQPRISEQMRMPWQRDNTNYLRRWTLSSNLDCDLPTPCIPDEASFVATEGGESKDKEGKIVKWRRADSWGDVFGFGEEVKEGQIAYAFRNIPRTKAGPVRLSIGTDNGVRVWVNGRPVLARDGRRKLTLDDDLVDVDMKAGDNQLLIKLAATDTFSARVLESGAQLKRFAEIAPDIIEMQPELFTIRTDSSKARSALDEVRVDVLAPGGDVKFSARTRRGELVVVDAKGWPDGPYEARLVTMNHLGLHYVTYRPWYKGNALDKARELEKTASGADATKPEGFTLKMLAEMVEDRLEAKLAEVKGNPWPKIHSPLMEYDELMLERAGKPGRVRAGGFVRLAWIDETDGTPQYCRAYLPWNYDAAKKWPTLVQLHGYNPANPKYFDWWGADNRHASSETEFAGNRSIIYIEPHGRGNTQYYAFGGADVKRCLAEAKRALAVDEDRVYLTGESMGGWGTWNVGTRNPELFAAIAPVFGGTDYHAATEEEKLAKLTPLEHFLNDRESSWAQAESLNNLPIFVDHGDQDGAVKVEWSRWGVRMLQRWGYDVRYHEYPGKVHETLSWSNPLMNVESMLDFRRDAHPRQVRVRSAELRNARAYWVRVEQRARPLEFMLVDAELIDANVIRLDTQNVVDVVLSAGPLIDAAKPVKIVWNGVPRDMKLPASGELRLTDAAYRPAALNKTPGLPGSFNDFFNTPFALVVGTSSKDARMRERCRLQAEQFAYSWEQWQKFRPRFFLDSEIGEAEIAKYSLILFGGPDANRVTASLSSQVPLRIRGDVITVGGKAYAARDAGVELLYPNPRNPQRYLWIAAGTSASGMGFAAPSPYNLPEWDFYIEDGHVPAAKEDVMRERTRVVSGMFDQNWRYDAAFVLPGDEQVRKNGRRMRMPSGARADAKLLAEIAGKYQFSPGPLVTLESKDGKLFLSTDGEKDRDELELIDGLEFYLPRFNVWVWFERDAAGKVSAIKAYAGEDLEGKRVE